MPARDAVLEVSTDRLDDGRLVARVEGEFCLSTAPVFDEVLDPVIGDDTPPDVVLDLSALRFLDSTGLKSILRVRRRLADVGRALVLRSPQGVVRRVLDISGVTDIVGLEGVQPASRR